jgi:hypothetical protein
MISHGLVKSGIVVALVLATGAAADAQSVVAIREGTLTVDDRINHSVQISGTQGFSFDGNLASSYGPIDSCVSLECAPGTVIDLSDEWSGFDVGGIVQFRGKTYAEIGGISADASMFIAVSASVQLPAMSGQRETLTVPFDFAGAFLFGLQGSRPDSVPITGGGTVTITLVPLAEDPNLWHIELVVFEFTPVERR